MRLLVLAFRLRWFLFCSEYPVPLVLEITIVYGCRACTRATLAFPLGPWHTAQDSTPLTGSVIIEACTWAVRLS